MANLMPMRDFMTSSELIVGKHYLCINTPSVFLSAGGGHYDDQLIERLLRRLRYRREFAVFDCSAWSNADDRATERHRSPDQASRLPPLARIGAKGKRKTVRASRASIPK
jgi:hypothetical protein